MKLSIALMTYNHEPFIVRALDGIVMQIVDFDFEIVVGDDCSTDRTVQIIEDYRNHYTGLIHILPNSKNLGPVRNLTRIIEACQGDYIALLDGDDYWITRNKLMSQISFLDKNRHCTICFHNSLMIDTDNPTTPASKYCPKNLDPYTKLENLLLSNYLPTSSVVFRNRLFDKFPNWYFEMPFYDFPLHILNALYGDLGYIDEVMAVYRIHKSGLWSQSNFKRRLISDLIMYGILKTVLDSSANMIIKKAEKKRWDGLEQAILEDTIKHKTIENSLSMFHDQIDLIQQKLHTTKDWTRSLLSKIYRHYASHSFSHGDFKHAWKYWLKSLNNSPSYLRDRGFLSTGIKILSGSLRIRGE